MEIIGLAVTVIVSVPILLALILWKLTQIERGLK